MIDGEGRVNQLGADALEQVELLGEFSSNMKCVLF